MIIVTGATGFIGSNIVRALFESGHRQIIACDWFGKNDPKEGEKWKNLASSYVSDFVFPEDLLDTIDQYQSEIKAIIHMGAISSTTETDVDLIMGHNFVLSSRILEKCTAYGIRLIYASSAATYGDGSYGFVDRMDAEAYHKLAPLNAYGWSKKAFDEKLLNMQEAGDDLPPQWVGLKFFNVYGPNEYHKGDMRSVMHKLYGQIQAGESVKLFKSYLPEYQDGGQLRDFVYVKDCAAIVQHFLAHPAISGIFNAGTGQARSFKDLAEACFKALGKAPQIEYIPMPESLRDKYQYFTEADLSKLRSVGFTQDFTSLEDGIKDYYQTYLTQPNPYR